VIVAGDLAAVDPAGMERVGGDVGVFVGPDGVPVAVGDLAVVAPADNAGGAALLLGAINVIGELVIGDHMVKLGGGLVVPGAPGLPAVDADDRSLVPGEKNDVGVIRIEPDGVIIIAAGSALEGGERLAGVGGAIGRG